MSNHLLPIVGLVSHTRRVQSIYKKALRNLEVFYSRRAEFRYQAALMRQKFEENRCVKDRKQIGQIVAKAEKDLFERGHWHLRAFMYSPGGTAYEREVEPPDWVLDFWHPLEKAQYPEFFARREERKKEFVKQWRQTYENL